MVQVKLTYQGGRHLLEAGKYLSWLWVTSTLSGGVLQRSGRGTGRGGGSKGWSCALLREGQRRASIGDDGDRERGGALWLGCRGVKIQILHED